MLRMLDVIIGLVFVFTMLSIVCSAIAEGIEALVKRRARHLEAGLERLLAADGSSYVSQFYAHPLIRAFSDPGGRRPSYVPPRSFALAVLDVLAKADRARKEAVTEIDRLPDDALGNAVRALARQAKGRIDELVPSIERWFDDAMDRVASGYRRGTHWILVGLGLLLAGGLNADAVNIATTLATDPALRQSVVETALKTSGAGAGPQGRSSTRTAAGAAMEQLQGLSLPMGWSGEKMSQDPRGIPDSGTRWLSKVLGILVTGFALSMGAPFWFDVLNKVARLRTAVKPARSDEGE
jgi:hypothetical protein